MEREEGPPLKLRKHGPLNNRWTCVPANDDAIAEYALTFYPRDSTGLLLQRSGQYNKRHVELHWGPADTGKTISVLNKYRNATMCDLEFFNHTYTPFYTQFDWYDGAPVVLLDNFSGEIPIETLIQLLDGYPMRIPIQCGYMTWNPETVVITSEYHYTGWYHLPMSDPRIESLGRRFCESNKYVVSP